MVTAFIEAWLDRKGDPNKGIDVLIRIAISMGEAAGIALIFKKPFIDSWWLVIAMFFLIFDYIVHVLMSKHNPNFQIPQGQNWFTFTGKSSVWDKWELWVKIGPWGRFTVKAVVFIGAIIIFYIG